MKHTRYRDRKKKDEADRPAPKTWREGWAWKSVTLALRASAAMFFCAYVLMCGAMGWQWVKIKWARHYPIETAAVLARTYLLERNDPEKLRAWLAVRPAEEADKLIAMLKPFEPRMSGLTFILYSDWMVIQNRMEEAIFWRQYARFRTGYDSLRCGSTTAIKDIAAGMNDFPRPQIGQYFSEDETRIPRSIRKALEYDEKYPPKNDPSQFCKEITSRENEEGSVKRAMVPPQHWQEIHDMLRAVTMLQVLHMEKEQKEQGKLTPEEKNGAAEKKDEAGEKKKADRKKKPKP